MDKRRLPAVRKANASLPIIWFGDFRAYCASRNKVVTIGLNPSLKEFSERRFDTAIDWAKTDAGLRLSEALDQYFAVNPYWRWFRWFEAVLNVLGTSYKPGRFENRALHIDACSSLATDPTWGKLDESERAAIRRTDLFKRLLRILDPDVILLSTNDEIRKDLFGDFKPIGSALYEKKDGTPVRGASVRAYRKDAVLLLVGRNMRGTPFGGLSGDWLAKTIPHLLSSGVPPVTSFSSRHQPPPNNTTMRTAKHAVLRVQDKPTFNTIDEICEETGVDPRSVHRGFLRKPSALLPSDPGVYLWWPSTNSKNWDNRLSDDGKTFLSKSRKEPLDFAAIAEAANAGRLSAIFFRDSSNGGGYRFVGVFKTNLEESRKRLFHVFDRVSDELEV